MSKMANRDEWMPRTSRRGAGGFTLVELLVVIAIIVLLVAMLTPSMYRARQLTLRTTCRSGTHQVLDILTAYASSHQSVLPAGKRNLVNGYRGEHCIWVSDELHDLIAGNDHSAGLTECPSFTNGFGYHNQYGWVIGYNYLGNHPRMTELGHFDSPVRLTDRGDLALWTDLNNWSDGWTFVAHSDIGAVGVRAGGPPHYPRLDRVPCDPAAIGSEGGNVGYLDGSALWKPIDQMDVYITGEWGSSYPCLW